MDVAIHSRLLTHLFVSRCPISNFSPRTLLISTGATRHTMTSKISFKEIIKALKLFVSFHPDTFPLILSFENHCSLPYQEVMAEQLQSILGKSLYIPKEESLSLGRLPSPME